jgi:hypothetical protein
MPYHEFLTTPERAIYMGAEVKKTWKSKTNLHTSKLTSQLIAEQTTAFLKAGGKITKIRSGEKDEEAHAGEIEAQNR